jgi:hypothetical protein
LQELRKGIKNAMENKIKSLFMAKMI